jgi:hypothetical protein
MRKKEEEEGKKQNNGGIAMAWNRIGIESQSINLICSP